MHYKASKLSHYITIGSPHINVCIVSLMLSDEGNICILFYFFPKVIFQKFGMYAALPRGHTFIQKHLALFKPDLV